MKNILLLFALWCSLLTAFSQNHRTDSLRNLLKQVQADSLRANILINLSKEQLLTNPAETYSLAQQAFKLSTKTGYKSGVSRAATLISNVYISTGNYPKALEYSFLKLKIEEERENPESMAIAFTNIANVYNKQGDFKKAFSYAFQADSIIDAHKLKDLKLYSLLNIGDLLEKAGNLSAALDYTLKTYALAVKQGDVNFQGASLNNLGNIYGRMKNPVLAIEQYTKALPFLKATHDNGFVAESFIGLAKQYLLLSHYDSSIYYGMKSYSISKENGFLSKELDACIFLSHYYKEKQDIDSAFHYQEAMLELKDSIYSKERIAKSQLLSTEEELRQKEMEEKKQEEAAERTMKLQYLTIGLLLPVLFFITIYLSNRKIKPKIIEFLGIVSLLLTFEYIMLLLHPLIVKITHHMPFYQLLIFAVIASVLTPLHHRVENWLIKILTRKEKVSLMKIRIQ